MDKVHQFFSAFIKAEAEAARHKRLPDTAVYNNSLSNMDDFLSDSLKTRFGMLLATEPQPGEYYEKVKKMAPVTPRFLFRIDTVETKKYGILYKAFVSDINSDLTYFHCLIAQPAGDTFQIIIRFTYGLGRDGSNKSHWYNSGGEGMSFTDLQPITETLRLLAPEDDEESMKQYSK